MNVHSSLVLRRQPKPYVPEKRTLLLEAALELFAERGFHGTAVPEIAAKANVAAGTLYRYFPSKEALVNVLYQEQKRALAHAVLDSLPSERPREIFAAIWKRLGQFAQENPRGLAFLELHHHAPYLDERSRAMDELIMEPTRAFILRAQQEGAIKKLAPDLLIAMAFGAFTGIAKAGQQGTLEISKESLRASEACVWEMLCAVPRRGG